LAADDRVGGPPCPISIDGSLVVAALSLVVSVLAYWQANKKAEEAKRASALALRLQAIGHIRNAMYDTHKDGNITTKTTDSIQQSAHLSRVVFPDSITRTVERALAISNRIQHTPSERQNERYDQDEDALKNCLEEALDLMNKETSIG
jgi:hypothetical protein